MNSLAFLVMLASYALVLGWYALNHERDADGHEGILGVRTKEEAEPEARQPGHVLRAVRGSKVIGDRETGLVYATPAERVKARAASAARTEEGAADAH